SLYNKEQTDSFDLPTDTRATLSTILIVHPIAALFTLIMFGMAAAAHFHAPSHSPRYLLGIFILSILTLITSLLSFLIDVLLFVPHMAWGSYIVLAATILIAMSGIVSCAMRRTLVSRKARKRRIAENAEMNGENFYNRQGPEPVPLPPKTTTLVDNDSAVDKLPTFATFEMAKKDAEGTNDERIPLTSRTPPEISRGNEDGAAIVELNDRHGNPPRIGEVSQSDQYGNIIPRGPSGPYSNQNRVPSADPPLNRQYSDNSMGSRGRAGYRGGPRGGGFLPNGRGGPQRGGYWGPYGRDPGMGGPGPGDMMRGGRGGAPPAYGRGGYDSRGQTPDIYGQRRPINDQYAPPVTRPTGGYTAYNPDDSRSSLPRAESPPPMP
ncbi:unnamed protein product, partial [Diplocarpon coronariae]